MSITAGALPTAGIGADENCTACHTGVCGTAPRTVRAFNYALNMMSEQRVEAAKTEVDELLSAYALAVVEFNLATAPLVVALTAGVRPSAADIKREENARAAVVEARRKVWAHQAEGRRRKEIRRRGRLPP